MKSTGGSAFHANPYPMAVTDKIPVKRQRVFPRPRRVAAMLTVILTPILRVEMQKDRVDFPREAGRAG